MGWPPALTMALAVPLAWGLDARFGEPRDAWHPVAWLGLVLTPIGLWLRARRPALAFIGGSVVWMTFAIVIAVAADALQTRLLQTSPWVAAPVLALLLNPTFAWRMLRDEAVAVERAMGEGVAAARTRLARLVSRDVALLDAELIRETTIETVAENLNDSLVAPLFWYALFGLPGAAVYRFANTADAMWGYHGAWEWAGKWSARADDVLSWLPARITAMLLLASGRVRAEAQRTPSPNSGWPMGAMALWLGVRLRKPGVYALNGGAPSPQAGHVQRGLDHAGRVAIAAVVLATAAWLGRAA